MCVPVCVCLCVYELVRVLTRVCASECLECVVWASFCLSVSVQNSRGCNTCICASGCLEFVCFFYLPVHVQSGKGL